MLELELFDDADAVARRGAELIAERAAAATVKDGRFNLAVSGGRTPWAMFAHLAGMDVFWDRVSMFQVDERIAPRGDAGRNLTHLVEALPGAARRALRPMPVEDDDPEAAAAAYAAELQPLDLVHLGLGDDGHTASLVPGDTVLEVRDRDVALTGGEYQGTRRMTLTYPAIDRAAEVLWVVTGAEKREPLARLRAGDTSIPAGRVRAARMLVLADRAAAG